MIRAIGLMLLLLAIGVGSAARAKGGEPRLALVIANGAYSHFDRLGATYGDGEKIAAALSATGVADASGEGAVRVRRDLTEAAMRAEIADFRKRLAAAGNDAFGIVYFSGHGVAAESGGDVIVLGTDAQATQISRGSPLSRAALTRSLMQSGARTVLVVLDMCRNVVPLASAPAPAPAPVGAVEDAVAGSKGLKRVIREDTAAIRPDQGYLVAYSTSAGQIAFDDGIFSKVLAEEIRRPRQNIADALKRVSDRVALKKTGAFQKPTFDYGLQGSAPCFVSCDPASGDRFYDCANCPWMRVLPSGTGAYGSPQGEAARKPDEPVQQSRKIGRSFAIGVYEVTSAEWTACVRDGGCARMTGWEKENPNPLVPATGIGFADATAFVQWLARQSGRMYRLPTDEEWEYAARAGASAAFPWGNAISPADANYDQTARYQGSPTAPYRGYPEAVTGYPPNGFGLYQTQGNVWEWTSGCADSTCQRRIVRGGSFQSVPAELRTANRFAVSATKARDDFGLRVARDLDADEVIAAH